MQFYERRVRRIFPALLLMLGCSALASAWLLYPDDYERFARSLMAATLFLSSFLFDRESGYFDGAAEEKPLLHTWSLSVEELFYLGFPLILFFARRLFGRRWFWLIGLFALWSFVASVSTLRLDPSSTSAFYLVHYRAWELLLGAMLALHENLIRFPDYAHRSLTLAGILLILVPVVSYTPNTPFPGLAALAPCLGTAIVIYFGKGARISGARLLAWRPLVFVGLISYSLYLWHWPVFVFFAHWAGRRATSWETVGLIALSVVIAVFSWRWIEQPFRGVRGLLSRRMLFSAAALAMAILVAVGLHGDLSAGWTGRYGKAFQALEAARDDRDPRQEDCLSPRPEPSGCDYGAPRARPTAVLWGDSHASVYAAALGELAEMRDESVRVFTMWSCLPTTGWQVVGQEWLRQCAELQDLAMETIQTSTSVRSVAMAAWFRKVPVLADKEGATEAFYRTVGRLLAAGKAVVLVYPVPELSGYRDGMQQTRVVAQPGGGEAVVSQSTSDFLAATRDAFHWLDALGERDNLFRVYPHEALCDERYCYAARGAVGYYVDEHHLSLSGAALVSSSLEAAVFGSRRPERGLSGAAAGAASRAGVCLVPGPVQK